MMTMVSLETRSLLLRPLAPSDVEPMLAMSQEDCARKWLPSQVYRDEAHAASAVDWLQSYNPQASAIWIAGFSFGAWIGMQLLMRRPEISGFISIAPPANIYDFSFLAPCPSSGLMVQGDRDDVVPHESVAKLVQKLSNQRDIKIEYKILKGATHFFTEHLDQLRATVDDYLTRALPVPAKGKTRAAAK